MITVLSVGVGAVLALAGVADVEPGDPDVRHLVELTLVLTLMADGLVVDRELLLTHWGAPARALAFAMPLTLVLIGAMALLLFGQLTTAEAFLLAAVLTPTDPVVTSSIVTSKRVPARVRHTLNLESGLNDGLALPFVLFFLVLATPGGDAGQEALKLLGEAAFGGVVGVVLGVAGGRLHRAAGSGGSPFWGFFAIGLGVAAYGLADVTFGNGLIAAFVAGIALGAADREIPEHFTNFAEKVSSLFQVLTFALFGALIVATGYFASIPALVAFIALALFVARPVALAASFAGADFARPERIFMAWFGPKGVASMLFALLVLDSAAEHGELIFKIAAFAIVSSIFAHGLTDTMGAKWVEARMRGAGNG